MEPIYLPRHRIDLNELVDIVFKKSLKRLLFVSLMGGLLAGLIVYTVVMADDDASIRLAISAATGVVVFGVSFLLYKSRFRSIYRRPANRLMFEDRTVILDEKSLKIEYSTGMGSTIPWTAVVKAEWTEQLLLLFITQTQFLILPRRLVDDKLKILIDIWLEEARKEKANALPKAKII
jgi:hypothetical protein